MDTQTFTKTLLDFKFPINRRRENTFNPGETHRCMCLGLIYVRPCCWYNEAGEKVNSSYQPCSLLKKHKYQEIFQQTKDWIHNIYPDFPIEYTSIQYNYNNQCRKHIDGKNVGESFIIGLGDYNGGRLIIYDDNDNPHYIDIKNKFVRFNGSRYYHEVEDWTGIRMSLVFFNILKDKDKIYKKSVNFE